MKGILIAAFTGSFLLAAAQTPLIAHKSHSGTAVDFLIDPSSNFGRREDVDFNPYFEQPKILVNHKFTPLNDSTILVELLNWEEKVILTDTLPKHSVDLLQYYHQDSIRKAEEKRFNEEIKRQQERLKQQELQQQQLNEPTPKKREKKSYLLFLFSITGGGMLLMRLFQRSKSQRSIA